MHTLTPVTSLLTLTTAMANAGGLTTYENRAEFDLQTGTQQIETFESEALGQFAMPTAFASGLNARFASGGVSSLIEAGDPFGAGFQNTTDGGRKYLRFGQRVPGGADETGSYSVEFTFGANVQAFGFDISGFQPNFGAGGFQISLFNGVQLVEDVFVPSTQALNEVGFYGFVRAGGFDAARVFIPVLKFDQAADYVAFDDVTWASVPSPASATLLAFGGLLGARRRR